MPVLELVVYTIKPEALGGINAHRNEMRRALSQWDGFLSGITFQSLDNANAFVDYYLWNNLTQARKAAERIESAPEARGFLDCISQVVVFKHFEVEGDQPSFTKADEGDVFEIGMSVVDPDKRETYRSIRPEVLALAGREKGFKEVASFEAESDEGPICLDVLRWQSIDAANEAMENINKTEQCGVFMSTFKKTVYFDHMRLFQEKDG